jgi:hypothetical protein
MGKAIQLLDNALRAWEDLQLINEAYLRYRTHMGERKSQDLLPPFKYWRQLRKQLLMASTQGFDFTRFCHLEDPSEGDFLYAGTECFFNEVPLQVASWITSPRRVFTLSEDMVQRFISADYSNYNWSDLLWPFDSFFINLEKPLVFETKKENGGNASLGGALVTSISQICPNYPRVEEDGFEIGYFFTAENGNEYPTGILSESDHRWLSQHLLNRQWRKVGKHLSNATQILFSPDQDPQVRKFPAGGIDPQVLKKGAKVKEAESICASIIAGLCLYLEALPSGIVESYGWGQASPKARRDVRKIITDEEQVCCVEDFHVISPSTMSLFPETLRQGPVYTVTPHWRRAHYRRARGQGKNPNAPRNVYVGPTLIHKEQVPEGALPGGSVSSAR